MEILELFSNLFNNPFALGAWGIALVIIFSMQRELNGSANEKRSYWSSNVAKGLNLCTSAIENRKIEINPLIAEEITRKTLARNSKQFGLKQRVLGYFSDSNPHKSSEVKALKMCAVVLEADLAKFSQKIRQPFGISAAILA